MVQLTGTESDAELIGRYRQHGDWQALTQLFIRYQSHIREWCVGFLNTDHGSQDAVMDIFLIIQRDLQTVEVVAWKEWLYVVCRNHCYQQLERDRRWRQCLAELPRQVELFPTFEEIPLPLRLLEQEETFRDMHQAINRLVTQQSQCIRMHYLEGKSYKAIAAALNYPEKSVKSHIQNGRRRLRSWVRMLES